MFDLFDELGNIIDKSGKAINDVTQTAKGIVDIGCQYNQNPEVIRYREQRQTNMTERLKIRNENRLEKKQIKAEQKITQERERTERLKIKAQLKEKKQADKLERKQLKAEQRGKRQK